MRNKKGNSNKKETIKVTVVMWPVTLLNLFTIQVTLMSGGGEWPLSRCNEIKNARI